MERSEFKRARKIIKRSSSDGVRVLSEPPVPAAERWDMEVYVQSSEHEQRLMQALGVIGMLSPEGPLVLVSEKSYAGSHGGLLLKLADFRMPETFQYLEKHPPTLIYH